MAELKGRASMAKVVARAVANRQRLPAGPRKLNVEGTTLTLTPRQVIRARDRARATGKPHNEARTTFVKILLRELDGAAHGRAEEVRRRRQQHGPRLPDRRRRDLPRRADRAEPVLDAADSGVADRGTVQPSRRTLRPPPRS